MHIQIHSSILQEAIKTVSHGVSTSVSTPILENILIHVGNGRVVLTANNLEIAIEYEITDGVQIHEPGDITVSYRFIASYVSLLHDEDVTIKKETGQTLSFTTKNNTTQFKGISADEFPVIPSIRRDISFKIDTTQLRKALSKTLFSCASTNIRPTLAGVYCKISPDEIVFASTDSFRLSEYKIPNAVNIEKGFSIIIPARTANEIMKMLADDSHVEMFISENQLLVIFEKTQLYSRLLNGHFPDYANFFPKGHNTKAVIKRRDLIQSLKQISLISRENNFNTKMFFKVDDKKIELDTGDTEVGTGNVFLQVDIE